MDDAWNYLSIQFSAVYYVILISTILVLILDELKRNNQAVMVFFVCLGGVTNWLDFLTYPLAALGIPLLMLMTLRNEGEGSFNCKDTIKAVLCWGAGYSGMWILKWCLATIIMHRNIFENAINQARFRTSQTVYDVRHSRTEVIITNMREMFKRPYFVALLVSVLYCVRMALPLIRSKVYRTLPYFFCFYDAVRLVYGNV